MARINFLLCLTLCIKLILGQDRDYRFIFSIFRHGARAPQEKVVNGVDLLGNTWASPGELTEVGMRMHFLLGRRNRQKYDGFISTKYNPLEIYIRTSEYNRTMMSVQSQLQGLYSPPAGPSLTQWQKDHAFPTINKNFGGFDTQTDAALPGQMQVFPVHVMSPIERQYFFFFGFDLCTPLLDVLSANEKEPAIVDFVKSFRATYESKLNAAFGLKSEYWDVYHHIFVFFDTFIAGYTHGFPFTNLVNLGVDLVALNKTAYDFSELDILNYYNGGSDLYLPKVTVAAFWNDLKMWLNNRVNNDLAGKTAYTGFSAPKMVLYSTHDVTLGSLLKYMQKAFNWDKVYYTPFASSMNIELTRPKGKTATVASDYQILINYNDNIYGPYSVTFFIQEMEKNLWSQTDVEDYCSGMNWLVGAVFRRATIGLGVLFAFFCILFFVTLIVCLCCYQRKTEGTQVATTVADNKA